jgi:hypothetical protein
MCDSAVERWNAAWLPFEPDVRLNQRAEELVRRKFALREYNQRR